jgi:hypothetical protein
MGNGIEDLIAAARELRGLKHEAEAELAGQTDGESAG